MDRHVKNAKDFKKALDSIREDLRGKFLDIGWSHLSNDSYETPLLSIDLIEEHLLPVWEREGGYPMSFEDQSLPFVSLLAMYDDNKVFLGGVIIPLVLNTIYMMGYNQRGSEQPLESQINIDVDGD